MIAEKLKYSDYTTKWSANEYLFECPSCGTVGKELEHGKIFRCKCGLAMRKLGNALQCISDKPAGEEDFRKLSK